MYIYIYNTWIYIFVYIQIYVYICIYLYHAKTSLKQKTTSNVYTPHHSPPPSPFLFFSTPASWPKWTAPAAEVEKEASRTETSTRQARRMPCTRPPGPGRRPRVASAVVTVAGRRTWGGGPTCSRALPSSASRCRSAAHRRPGPIWEEWAAPPPVCRPWACTACPPMAGARLLDTWVEGRWDPP